MSYHGDIPSQQTLYFTFTTHVSGVPTVLAGTPALSVYKDDSTTQSTEGITLVASLDSVVGLNSVKIITTNAFYEAGHDYSVVITTGTVGGVSAVGYVVGNFSIENRSALRPTVPARTLDVTATGAAGIDWANVESKDAAVDLTNTKTLYVNSTGGIPAIDATSIAFADETNLDTKLTGVETTLNGLNDLSAADVNAEVDTALSDINLDHLIKNAKDTSWAVTVTKESVIDLMTSKTTAQAYDRATDALEAVSDKVTTVSAGVASSITATANTETTGTLVSGTYADTYLSNGTYYITAPVTPAVGGYGLNAYLTLGAASGQYINSVTIRGYYQGNGRYCNVGAYNYVTDAIDILSDTTSRMNHATANATYSYSLLSAHQKADGEVRIYFLSPSTTTADRLRVDQLLVNVNTAGASAADIAAAVKQNMITLYYPDGVWIDTTGGGTAGTVTGTNGLSTNPCSTYADAIAICASLNIKKLMLKNGSVITLTQSLENWTITGGVINLGSQVITHANFIDCYTVQGVSSGDDYTMELCGVGTMTGAHGYFYDCAFKGTFTMLASQVYYLFDCVDFTNSATACQFVYAANAELIARGWKGGIDLLSMAATNTTVIDGAGRVVIDASSVGGSLTVRGNFPEPTGLTAFLAAGGTLTDNARWAEDQSMALVTLVTTTTTATNLTNAPTNGDLTATMKASVGDAVWDEALSGHSGAGTAGLALATASSGGVDPSVLADAIWDEALSGHATAGTAGKKLTDLVNTDISSIPTDAENAAAVLAAATLTPIHANVKETNDIEIIGTGIIGVDEWRRRP